MTSTTTAAIEKKIQIKNYPIVQVGARVPVETRDILKMIALKKRVTLQHLIETYISRGIDADKHILEE